MGEDLIEIGGNQAKTPVQLTWEKITITAMPPVGKCGKKAKTGMQEPKIILDGVSGTVMPGQFVAIIGASGKYNQETSDVTLNYRCW